MTQHLGIGDYDLRTPLHLAASNGHFKTVRYLVEKCGVEVNCKDRWGSTPLNDAAKQNIIDFLLEKGGEYGVQQKEYKVTDDNVLSKDKYRFLYAAFENELNLTKS